MAAGFAPGSHHLLSISPSEHAEPRRRSDESLLFHDFLATPPGNRSLATRETLLASASPRSPTRLDLISLEIRAISRVRLPPRLWPRALHLRRWFLRRGKAVRLGNGIIESRANAVKSGKEKLRTLTARLLKLLCDVFRSCERKGFSIRNKRRKE